MSSWINILPEAILSVTATMVLIISALASTDAMRDFLRWVSAFAILGSATALVFVSGNLGVSPDGWTISTPFTTSISLVLLTLLGWSVLSSPVSGKAAGEWFALVLFAALGSLVLARVGNLPAVFLGIEALSLSLYILVAFRYTKKISLRGGSIYLVLAGVGSAFLVYGMALIYAVYGTFSIGDLRNVIQTTQMPLLANFGFGMFLVGVGFKLAAVPFHMWAPDVYEAAPPAAAGVIASASKGATMAALLPFAFLVQTHLTVLIVICALSMIIGNLLGLRETRVKRILAYSSVAHVGYILLGFISIKGGTPLVLPHTISPEGAIVFYILVYGISALGAFTALGYMKSNSVVTLNDMHGLARKHPIPSACLLIFTLSLAGLPISVGFWGKLYLFSAAFQAGFYQLSVLGLIGSAIGLFYYLRIIVHLYMVSPEMNPRDSDAPISNFQTGMLILAASAVIVFSLFPDYLYSLIRFTG